MTSEIFRTRLAHMELLTVRTFTEDGLCGLPRLRWVSSGSFSTRSPICTNTSSRLIVRIGLPTDVLRCPSSRVVTPYARTKAFPAGYEFH